MEGCWQKFYQPHEKNHTVIPSSHCGNPKTRGPSHPHKVNLPFRVKIGIGWYPIYSIYCALPFTMMGPTIAIMLWCLSRWYFVVSFYFEQELTSNRTVIRHTATHWEIWIQNFPLLYQFSCNININIHQFLFFAKFCGLILFGTRTDKQSSSNETQLTQAREIWFQNYPIIY